MTKSDLIQQLRDDSGLSRSQTGKIVNDVFDQIAAALSKGDDVRITGFGTFKVAETKERPGRNPRTGQVITVPAGKRVSFAAGSTLLEAVKGGETSRPA